MFELRKQAAAILLDAPRYLIRLAQPHGWIRIGNRNDRLEYSMTGPGVRCADRWSSDLIACTLVPAFGRLLMRKALVEWPIRFSEDPGVRDEPDVSFVIPFRGAERLPLLRLTIKSIFGQRGVKTECIVVEQGPESHAEEMPEGIRFLHLPHSGDRGGWYKSWALNIGVEAARAPVVICHDADILAPRDYSREALNRLNLQGFDVAHLQRFLFCMNPDNTARIVQSGSLQGSVPERVRQNWQGGTVAIRKEAFYRIGGFDERFVGWGGEDNEFFERCTTLHGWRHGYLPFIHLWHEPQPTKCPEGDNPNAALFKKLIKITSHRRIDYLCGRKSTYAGGEGEPFEAARRRGKLVVSLTFDDALDVHLDMVAPLLEKYHMTGTFYVNIASSCFFRRLDEWKKLTEGGHELGNHTLFHPAVMDKGWITEGNALEKYSPDRMRIELKLANDILRYVDGETIRTYAYPCSNPVLGSPGILKRLLKNLGLDHTRFNSLIGKLGFLDFGASEMDYCRILKDLFFAARLGGYPAGDVDSLPGDRYKVCCIPGDGKNRDALIADVEESIGKRNWIVFMFHGVGGGHNLSCGKEDFERFLGFLSEDSRLDVKTFLEAAKDIWR